MELKEYHYVYYSYEEWGRGYFGSRTCKCLPEKDVKYFGSYADKTFKPTQKIILKDDYATREEAYTDEIVLQNYYKVVENPHFANRSYQTSTGFSQKGRIPWNKGIPRDPETIRKMSESRKGKPSPNKGIPRDPETIRKMSESRKGKPSSNKGKRMSLEQRQKLSIACKGKTVSEETKKKISKSTKGKKLTEDHKRKIAEANRGTPKTMTEKRRQSDIEKGLRARGKPKQKHSEETKKKISKATQGRIPWNKGLKGRVPWNKGLKGVQKNPRAIKVCYDGVIYESIKDAMEKTNKSRFYIKKHGTMMLP